MIHIGGKTYELVQEYKNGYNYEALRDRYSEVLDRYDYIVGDWGYSQLRLKGFFKESNKNGTKDTSMSGLQDYLNEYCNFGCAYFILRKIGGKPSEMPNGDQPEAVPAQTHAAAPQTVQGSPPNQPQHQRHERHERRDRHDRNDRGERKERHSRPERQERQQPQG